MDVAVVVDVPDVADGLRELLKAVSHAQAGEVDARYSLSTDDVRGREAVAGVVRDKVVDDVAYGGRRVSLCDEPALEVLREIVAGDGVLKDAGRSQSLVDADDDASEQGRAVFGKQDLLAQARDVRDIPIAALPGLAGDHVL